MSFGRFLSGLFDETKKNSEASRKKADEEKQHKIGMYEGVVRDHRSVDEGGPTDEQRDNAAKEADKLYGGKGKDGPHSQLSGVLNIMSKLRGGGKKEQGQQPQGESKQEASLPDQGKGGGPLTAGGPKMTPLAKPQGQEKQPQEKPQGDPNIPPAKKNIVTRGLTKLTQGLGLAPLNTGVFRPPSKEDREKAGASEYKMSEYRNELKKAVPGISDEQLDKAVENKFGAVPKQTTAGHTFTKKGTVSGKEIPADAMDALGNPIDKSKQYDMLQSASGDKEYIASQGKHQIRTLADETGKPADFIVDMSDPSKLVKIGAKAEQAEYKIFTDPDTQEQYAKPVPRFVSKQGAKGQDAKGDTPEPSKTFPPLKSTPSASNGHSKGITPLVPPKAAVAKLDKLGKEATGEYKGISLGKKDTSAARAKAEQALVVMTQGEDLIKQIEGSRDALGPWSGRISSFDVGLGSSDEKVRSLYTSLKSFAALQPALHGSRGIGMQKEFENASGRLADNPDAAIAAIRSLMNTARHFAEVGGEGKNVPKGEKPNANAEKEAQAYLDSLGKK